jgi:hypothetical protein
MRFWASLLKHADKSHVLDNASAVTPDPAHKRAVQAAEKLFDGIQPIMMRSLRRQLASAEAKAAFGDAEAAVEAEYFRLSIKQSLRDHEKTRASFVSKFSRKISSGSMRH